ncbi:hypothetical protein [Aeromonas intestinalis]
MKKWEAKSSQRSHASATTMDNADSLWCSSYQSVRVAIGPLIQEYS